MIQSRHFGGLIRVMTRQSYTCKFPARAGRGVGRVQTVQTLRLWLRDVPLVTFNAWCSVARSSLAWSVGCSNRGREHGQLLLSTPFRKMAKEPSGRVSDLRFWFEQSSPWGLLLCCIILFGKRSSRNCPAGWGNEMLTEGENTESPTSLRLVFGCGARLWQGA